MAWIDPQRLLLVASAVAMLLLGAALAVLDFDKLVNRAFAAFLTLRGAALLLPQLSPSGQWAAFTVDIQPYFTLALVPSALYFASMYPRRRGWLGRPGGGWVTVGLIVALEAAYFANHGLYYSTAKGVSELAVLQASGPGQRYYTGFGPLVVLGSGAYLVLSALSVLFVRDYTRSDPGPQRTSFFLVASGFLLNGLFDGSRQLYILWSILEHPQGYPFADWGWAVAFLPSLALLPALAALAYVVVHRFRGRAQERRLESRLLVVAPIAALSGLTNFFLPPSHDIYSNPWMLLLLGLWRLSLPALVTYALLRYALFDIDIKVRAGLAWSLVAAAFGAAFFFGSEFIEGQIAKEYGNWGGLGAAALLAVFSKPLVALGRKTAALLMPGVRDLGRVEKSYAADIYRQQFLMLQEDGVLTSKERASLDGLRARLGLGEVAARSIERAVVG
jgi:hypothetical protein